MLKIQKKAANKSKNSFHGASYASKIFKIYAVASNIDCTTVMSLFFFKNSLLYDGN